MSAITLFRARLSSHLLLSATTRTRTANRNVASLLYETWLHGVHTNWKCRAAIDADAMLGTSARREMVALQMDLDAEVFDSSLGCPLASYQDATLSLVGGKALQCWRLMRQGFPVPESFILPTYVYSMHIGEAGVVDLINEVFSSDFTDEAVRESNQTKLATIRKLIMETPLNEEVKENLQEFLDTASPWRSCCRSLLWESYNQ